MADLRRYLLRLLLFGLCCALGYPVLLNTWSALLPSPDIPNLKYPLDNYGMMRLRLNELEQHGPVDVVFLGSSHAYRGFDPRIWEARGYSSFNLGSSSQTPLQTEVLVHDFIDVLQPRLALLEVHPNILRDDGVESSLDLIANHRIGWPTTRMALRVGHVLSFNALAYGKLRQLMGLDDDPRDPIERQDDGDRYIGDGYVEHVGGHFLAPDTSPQRRSSEPASDQLEALERVVNTLREDGIQVVLVEVPVTAWYDRSAYTDRERFDELMSRYAPYVNMNGKAALDDSLHFYDEQHLNQAGANVFNPALIDLLNAKGLLPEVR